MEFRVLGSLEIWDGDTQLEVTGSKRRVVLGILLLHANEVVGKDRLIEELWAGDPPRNAAASLHNTISRLRKVVGAERLVTRAWGYALRIEPEELDLHRFESLVADAEPLPAKERSAKLASALALWRGPALPDLAFEPGLTKEIARLEELHLAVLEARIDADLELGRNAGIIAELEALIAEHPLRERLRAQVILALYRSGRQAEALEVYRETRRLLADELGLEPSPELRELERAILRQDPSLSSAAQRLDPAAVGQTHARRRLSPLLLAAAVLLAAGGAAAAVLATTGGARHGAAAASTVPPATGRATVDSPTSQQKSIPTVTRHAGATRATTKHSVTPAPHIRRPPIRHHPRALPKTQTTTTGATNTTGSKPVARHSVAKVYWLADDFSEPTIDYSVWNLAGHGTGVQVAQQNGEVEFSISPDVTYDASGYGVDQHYGTDCFLKGNFSAQVDFSLLSWPEGDGLYVEFGAYFRPPNESFWSISREGRPVNGGVEAYEAGAGPNNTVATADTSGALRLSRENGLLAAYYRFKGSWVELASTYAPGPAGLVIGLSTNPDQFGRQAASAAFDNLEATAAAVDCYGVPLPPQRPKG